MSKGQISRHISIQLMTTNGVALPHVQYPFATFKTSG